MRRPVRNKGGVYEAVTRGLLVRVQPEYRPDQSAPEERRWVWAYQVEVENHGDVTVQLLTRRWVITDASGRVEVVEGPGVVGEQPTLKPGEAFRYVSGCPLPTPSGVMEGTYEMEEAEGGDRFPVDIPAFSLDVPGERRVVN